MRINNNIMAFNAYRNLSNTGMELGKSLERLSSGLRINRAADDAAGLTKSETLRAEVNGTKQAMQNSQDGISLVQTAEGALGEVHAILQRMRTLAVSAGNEATTDGSAEQAEVTELLAELNNINTNTTFAGNAVFDGAAKTFQIGSNSGNQLSVTVSATDATTLGVNAIDLSTDPSAAITAIDAAISATSTTRSTLGATQNRLESTIRNLGVQAENLQAAESRIRDADMAQEMVGFTRNQILQQAGTAMLAQANQAPQSVLSLLQ